MVDRLQHIPEHETRCTVKDSWAHGLIIGNAIWPQTRIGTVLFPFFELIDDMPDSWKDFSMSELSAKQLVGMKRDMTAFHGRHGVQIDLQTQDENGRLSGIFQSQWNIVKAHTVARFLQAFEPNITFDWNRNMTAPVSMTERNLLFLESAFSDNPGQIAEIAGIAYVGKQTFTGQYAINLSKEHIDRVKKYPRDNPERYIAAQKMKTKVQESIEEMFPQHDTNWILFGI